MNEERFEDDLRAAVRGMAPGEAPDALRHRLALITDEAARTAPWSRTAVHWAAYVVVAVAAVSLAIFVSAGRQPTGPASPSPTATLVDELVRLELGGLSVDHPPSWEYHEYDFVASFFDVIGYLTNRPFDRDSICTGDSNGVQCNFSGHPVEPGGVVVKFVHWQPPVAEMKAEPGETEVTVGGMPATFMESRAGDIVTLTWRVRQPEVPSGWYEIEARIREPDPDTAELRRQVEAMIDSLQFDLPPMILPQSGPEFDQQAPIAARQALASLKNQQYGEAYACFGEELGVPLQAIVNVTMQGPVSEPLKVTCTTFVESDVDVWRVRLVMAWAATGDQGAGRQETEVWVGSDGDAGRTMESGDSPPNAVCPPNCG